MHICFVVHNIFLVYGHILSLWDLPTWLFSWEVSYFQVGFHVWGLTLLFKLPLHIPLFSLLFPVFDNEYYSLYSLPMNNYLLHPETLNNRLFISTLCSSITSINFSGSTLLQLQDKLYIQLVKSPHFEHTQCVCNMISLCCGSV